MKHVEIRGGLEIMFYHVFVNSLNMWRQVVKNMFYHVFVNCLNKPRQAVVKNLHVSDTVLMLVMLWFLQTEEFHVHFSLIETF